MSVTGFDQNCRSHGSGPQRKKKKRETKRIPECTMVWPSLFTVSLRKKSWERVVYDTLLLNQNWVDPNYNHMKDGRRYGHWSFPSIILCLTASFSNPLPETRITSLNIWGFEFPKRKTAFSLGLSWIKIHIKN